MKKKHRDDIASLEMLISYDDCELIKNIGNWEIELTPVRNFLNKTIILIGMVIRKLMGNKKLKTFRFQLILLINYFS